MGLGEKWLARNGGMALVVAGILIFLSGVLVDLSDVGQVAVLVTGAGVLVAGIIYPNLDGVLKIGPKGLEASLRKADIEGQRKGLDEDDRAMVLFEMFRAYEGLKADSASSAASMAPSAHEEDGVATASQDWIDELIRQQRETHAVDVVEIPDEAVREIQQLEPNVELEVVEGQRRSGRGAPSWNIRTNDGTWWRVSNTRHGWNATRIEEPPTSSS